MTPPVTHRRSLCLIALAAMLTAPLLHAQQAQQAQQEQHGQHAPKKPAATASAEPGATAAANQKNALSYSLGVSMGEQLRSSGVAPDTVNAQRLAQGVHDGLVGNAKLTEADRRNISQLLRDSYQGSADANHSAAAKFLAENGKKPGVITTASGLQYRVLAPGNGDSPKASDEATVNYRGTLLDGTEFDSSYKRGEPATFPVSRVIPGWTEALQLMKPGAKYQLFVPPQLAYDMRAKPGIPPGSLLIFEVELLSFKAPQPAAAATPPAEPPAPAAPK